MAQVNTAIIGYGNMGSAHAAAIMGRRIPGLRLAAVCDIAPERLRAAAEALPGVACHGDRRSLLADPSIGAVIIATPHPLHAEIAMEALAAGKHVLTEKPIDIRVSQAHRLCEAARRGDRVFAIMFNQRTTPIFRRAREIVQSGQLGALKRSVWIITNWYRTQHYYDSGDWRATWAGEGGGVLLNQAPHNLDLWQWICGMPVAVRGFCDVARYHRIEVEDEAVLLTRYENGGTGMLVTSTGDYPGTNRLEISGELGKLVLEEGKLRWWRLRMPEPEVRFSSPESFGRIPFDYSEYDPEEPEAGHEGILKNFADAMLTGAPLIAPGQEGIRELTLSNAAYLSAWTGNEEIALPMDEARFDALLDERARNSAREARASAHDPGGRYNERWQVRW